MNKFVLKAEKRNLLGSKVKKLRRQGILPANVFGHDVESLAIQVSAVEFSRVYKEAGETSLIWLKVEPEDKERPTLVKGLTSNPVSGQKMHVDFHQVNLKEKVTANIPVEIVGESQLIKDGLAVLDTNIQEIEVEALPTDLPESLIFDISGLLEIGAQLKVSDVKLPSGVTLVTDPEATVVAIGAPQKEEEPLETEIVEAEVEGAAPAEGEAAKTEETKSE